MKKHTKIQLPSGVLWRKDWGMETIFRVLKLFSCEWMAPRIDSAIWMNLGKRQNIVREATFFRQITEMHSGDRGGDICSLP